MCSFLLLPQRSTILGCRIWPHPSYISFNTFSGSTRDVRVENRVAIGHGSSGLSGLYGPLHSWRGKDCKQYFQYGVYCESASFLINAFVAIYNPKTIRWIPYPAIEVKYVACVGVHKCRAISPKEDSSMTVKLGECMRSQWIRSECIFVQWGLPFTYNSKDKKEHNVPYSR